MKRNDKTSTVHVNIDNEILKNFDSAYPQCRKRFIQNALYLACQDKIIFDKIFFHALLAQNGNSINI